MLSLDFLDDVRRMNKRQLYYQVLNFGMIVSSALMIWKGLMVVTGSESPIVVVLRGGPGGGTEKELEDIEELNPSASEFCQTL
uniref:Signal peptidase complex catalytic subunit SEC11 n=1 Tax=Gallus gallus TaxID=9031 RepID=A0A8V0ZVE8_CHICK